MSVTKDDLLELMYRESAVLRQSQDYSVERITEAEQRLERAADRAEENNIDIPQILLSACRSGLSVEVNSLTAEMLDKPKTPS